MKTALLFACLLFSLAVSAQDTTIIKRRNETIIIIKNKNNPDSAVDKQRRSFDVGGGFQLNRLQAFSNFYGPFLCFRANERNGRLAGIVNLSYNIGSTFQALNYAWFFDYQKPKTLYLSDIRYNFLKVSAAMQVPFFNRTNKIGFSMSAVGGASYYNGMGSGQYLSYLDKPSGEYFGDKWHTGPSRKFSFNTNNLELVSFDIGLNFSYTLQRYQVFADASYLYYIPINHVYDDMDNQINGTLTAETDNNGMSIYNSPLNSICINIGLRYCLYTPWQKRPPGRLLMY